MARYENIRCTSLGIEGSFQERLLDSDEAAGLLKIHPKTLQRMARQGEINGFRIGKLWRFRVSELLAGRERGAECDGSQLGKMTVN